MAARTVRGFLRLRNLAQHFAYCLREPGVMGITPAIFAGSRSSWLAPAPLETAVWVTYPPQCQPAAAAMGRDRSISVSKAADKVVASPPLTPKQHANAIRWSRAAAWRGRYRGASAHM